MEKTRRPHFFCRRRNSFPIRNVKTTPYSPDISLDIVYWARVHAGGGRAAGRNFGGLHTFLSSTLKRLEDRSFFSLWPTDSPCIFRKRRRSLVGRCVCGKSKGVWGEMSRWECFPSFHLLKGQRAVRGFEGRGRREAKYFDSRESDCRTRKENISVLFMNSLAKFRKKGAKIPSTPKFSSMKSLTRKIQKFCSFFAGNDRRWKSSPLLLPRGIHFPSK